MARNNNHKEQRHHSVLKNITIEFSIRVMNMNIGNKWNHLFFIQIINQFPDNCLLSMMTIFQQHIVLSFGITYHQVPDLIKTYIWDINTFLLSLTRPSVSEPIR